MDYNNRYIEQLQKRLSEVIGVLIKVLNKEKLTAREKKITDRYTYSKQEEL